MIRSQPFPKKSSTSIGGRWFVVALMLTALTSHATPITFSAASGTRAAEATFVNSGGNLIVTLTNTSTFDVLVPVDVLTAVYFDFSGGSLTRVSALLNSGSSVYYGPSNGGNVGGEWAYKNGVSGAPFGANTVITATGLGLVGPTDNFPGENLQGPVSVNGLSYGLTSAGDDLLTGNTPVSGGYGLIKNSVVFTLGGFGGLTDPSLVISNVSFQYGTALTEPVLQVNVPDGGTTVLLLGAALALLALVSMFRRRRMVREKS